MTVLMPHTSWEICFITLNNLSKKVRDLLIKMTPNLRTTRIKSMKLLYKKLN